MRENNMTLQAPETVETNATRVACDGSGPDGSGLDGGGEHPNVWLEMGEGGQVQCPYCSRLFVLGKKGERS